jgi:probable HAF family extracellular repeat protein
MDTVRRLAVTALLALAVAQAGALPAAGPAAAAPARFRITDLGALGGGTSSATGISNAGFVSGVSGHAVRWSPGATRPTDLGLLPGGGHSVANGVNDVGQVAGTADRTNGGFGYPVRWSAAGDIQDLGGPVTNRLGAGNAIDPAGRVAGGQRPADSEGAELGIRYGVDGAPTELGPDLGMAHGIDIRGAVVGGAFSGPAYLWRNGAVTLLPPLSSAGGATAYAVNASGVVVGSSASADDFGTHAVRWVGGSPTDLGTIAGLRFSTATAVNAAGQVVGTADPGCSPCPAPQAWLWEPGRTITPLNGLLPAGSGWTLHSATGINDRGQIVGTGDHAGVERAYLLTPVFDATVNFQPAASPVPAGYRMDSGAVFGNRGGGRSYGWDVDNSAATRDRNLPNSPDQRYDTFIHLQKPGGGRVWELAVPNGSYLVHAVSGDPCCTDSTFRLAVEGVTVVSGTPTSASHWMEGTARVVVSDGRLTVTNAAGAVNDKLAYIDVIAD